MALTLQSATAAILAEEAARKRIHEREALRSSGACWSGMGPGPFVGMTAAEVVEEAHRRVAAHNAPDAVLKRALIAAAEAGSLDASALVAASDRGSADWQDRARGLLGPKAVAA